MAQSKVKWFNDKKGYGFIVNPDGGEDIFVHYSNIDSHHRFKILKQDAEVHFELDSKGYHIVHNKIGEQAEE